SRFSPADDTCRSRWEQMRCSRTAQSRLATAHQRNVCSCEPVSIERRFKQTIVGFMSRTIGIVATACLGLILAHSPTARAEVVCQGGGKKEVAAACSVRVQKDGYYVIDASAEAAADKSSEG